MMSTDTSDRLLAWSMTEADLSGVPEKRRSMAASVLKDIAYFGDREGKCWRPKSALAAGLYAKVRTVSAMLETLAEVGLIEVGIGWMRVTPPNVEQGLSTCRAGPVNLLSRASQPAETDSEAAEAPECRAGPVNLLSRASQPAETESATRYIGDLDPPCSPPKGTERAGEHPSGLNPDTFGKLEQLALECIPNTGRRPRGLMLPSASSKRLIKLVEKHGHEAVKSGLEECDGAERPIAMLAKMLNDPRDPGDGKMPTARSIWDDR